MLINREKKTKKWEGYKGRVTAKSTAKPGLKDLCTSQSFHVFSYTNNGIQHKK